MTDWGFVSDWNKKGDFAYFGLNVSDREGIIILMVSVMGFRVWWAISPWSGDFN